MRRTLTIILCLISCQVLGQRDLEIITDDFNKDGVVDTLKSFYIGGSGFGGKYVQVINGETRETHELTNDGCFCQIKQTVLIPPALHKKENQYFLEAMKERLLPEKKNASDASLDWLISGAFSNVTLDSNSFFDLIIDPELNWSNDEFEYPYIYYIDIRGDTLNTLYSTPYEAPEWLNKNTEGFLFYYGHNHYRNPSGDSLTLVDSNNLYKIYRTSHGVMVKKGKRHKWVFITDVSLTGAPEKLRWESIKKVVLLDKYLIVQQDLPPTNTYQLFLINIESGICGRLKHDLSYSADYIEDKTKAFLIQEETIVLNLEEKQVTYKLKEILRELESQYINLHFIKNP